MISDSDPSRAELAKVIRDLLRIAKVAMPAKVFGEDPRVTYATALLSRLEYPASSARPPNVTSQPPRIDVAALAQRRAVEESASGISFVAELPWDLVGAMTAVEKLPADPSDAVNFIVRDWLTSIGKLDHDASEFGSN